MFKNIQILLWILFLNAACQENKTEYQVQMEVDSKSILGEGSIWDYQKQELIWVDINGKKLHFFNPESKENESFDMPSPIGTVVPIKNGGYLVALEDGIYEFNRETQELSLKVNPEAQIENNRFNDGKCDPAGRLWVGSLNYDSKEGAAHLWRIDHDFEFTHIKDSVTISNGIVWNSKKDKMYYIDTPTGKVMSYDYDLETGKVSNPTVAITIPESLGFPDGSTMDAEDKLWIALWSGHCITRWDPMTGELLEKIEIPALNVTSVAFGGEDLQTIYVTTSTEDMTEEQAKKYPYAGGLFSIRSNYKGQKSYYFNPAD